jgi:hypothetical protein
VIITIAQIAVIRSYYARRYREIHGQNWERIRVAMSIASANEQIKQIVQNILHRHFTDAAHEIASILEGEFETRVQDIIAELREHIEKDK